MEKKTEGKPPSRITILDVAAKAGVSVGTVSRFINGYNLKESSRGLVEKAIDELGYTQNVIARGMKTHRTYSIGVLLPMFDEFHTEVLGALQRFFDKRGYYVGISLCEGDERDLETKLRFLRERYTDGLIMSPSLSRTSQGVLRELQRCRDSGLPIITLNNRLPGWQTDHVHVDDAEAIRHAIDYLGHMNHREIALIAGSDESSTALERIEGYHRAMEDIGVPHSERQIVSGHWAAPDSGYHLAKRLLAAEGRRPTAVICANCILSLGVLEYVHEAGLGLPEDLSLVSFDDTKLFALHRPGITAIRQPVEAIAKAVADLMIRRLSGDWSEFPFDQRLQTSFVLRNSVGKI